MARTLQSTPSAFDLIAHLSGGHRKVVTRWNVAGFVGQAPVFVVDEPGRT